MSVQQKTIWVLGAGQLGAMLQHAGMPLGLKVQPVDIHAEQVPAVQPQDAVTAEREKWPTTAVTQVLAQHPHFVNRHVFGQLADRKTQKELLDQLGLATAPWCPVETHTQALQLHQQLGGRVLLKRRTDGYDGKGQFWLRNQGEAIPGPWLGAAIAEQAIDFDEEVSLVGVRNAAGECVFYPLTLNLHINGILYASIAPLARLRPLQAQAEAMLGRLLHALDYVGVMAMECFRLGDTLIINELAPRVHNSGHWTQAGASISQFEYHLRALAALPLPSPSLHSLSVMVNLIGTEYNPNWLALPQVQAYWYGKSVLPGRKVGHINCVAAEGVLLPNTLLQLQQLLDTPEYTTAINWVLKELNGG